MSDNSYDGDGFSAENISKPGLFKNNSGELKKSTNVPKKPTRFKTIEENGPYLKNKTNESSTGKLQNLRPKTFEETHAHEHPDVRTEIENLEVRERRSANRAKNPIRGRGPSYAQNKPSHFRNFKQGKGNFLTGDNAGGGVESSHRRGKRGGVAPTNPNLPTGHLTHKGESNYDSVSSKSAVVSLEIFQDEPYPDYHIQKTHFPSAEVVKKRLKIQALTVPVVFAVIGFVLFFALLKITQLWYVPVAFFAIQLLLFKFLAWRGNVAMRRMLSSNTAHEVTASSQPEIFHTVNTIFKKMNIPIIPVWIVEESTPNAFVTRLRRKTKVLVVTTTLLEIAKPEEFRGVIGHELGHVVNKDLEIRRAAQLLSLEYFLTIFAKIVKKEKDPYSYKKANAVGVIFDVLRAVSFFFLMVPLIIIRLLSLFASRSQEHLADLTSAEVLGGPNEIISGLRLLMRYEEAMRTKERKYSGRNVSSSGGRLSQITSTHPHLKNRIKLLQKLCATQITCP